MRSRKPVQPCNRAKKEEGIHDSYHAMAGVVENLFPVTALDVLTGNLMTGNIIYGISKEGANENNTNVTLWGKANYLFHVK